MPRFSTPAETLGDDLAKHLPSGDNERQWRHLMNEAQVICERFGEAPTRSLATIKRALDASARNSLDAQLDLERDLQREIGRGSDYLEGVTAFLEKRKPVYKGRA